MSPVDVLQSHWRQGYSCHPAEVERKKVSHVPTVGLGLWILCNNSSLFLIQSVNLIILNKERGRWEAGTIMGCDRVYLGSES